MRDTRAQTVVHIGGQKCGSSALQGYLFFGRFKLKEQGICYLDPDFGTDLKKAKSHAVLFPKLHKKGPEWVREQAAKLEWHDPKRHYVLTSEGFCQINNATVYAEALAPLSEFGPVHLIFYVRPQTEVLYSGWQQWGMHLPFADWVQDAIRRDFANWHVIWKAWRKSFPDARFTTRLFARKFFPDGDMVADFRETMGWPEVSLPVRRAANPTFDDLTILAVRRLAEENGVAPGPLVIAMKRAGVELPHSRENHVLCDGLKAEIEAHYASDNEVFLEASGLDSTSRAYFKQDHLPKLKDLTEGAVEAKMQELISCVRTTPGLEEYAELCTVSET